MQKIIVFIVTVCYCFSLNAQNISTEFTEAFAKKTTSLFDEYQLQGDFILGIVDEKGLIYSIAMNPEIIKGNTSTLNNNSPIYLASHTKSLTGTLLKILEDKKIIDIKQSLSHYLPELNFKGAIDTKAITIEMLLNHTHGIHGTMFTWKTAFLGYSGNNSELIDDLNNNHQYDQTHVFRYSNTGPILAAIIAEKVTGKSWKSLLEDYIFQPLKMNRTSGNVTDYKKDEIRPAIIVNSQNEVIQSGFYKANLTMHPAGGTLSTINDLSKWLQANIIQSKNILNTAESWNKLHNSTTNQDRTYFTYKRNGYSLGWDVATYENHKILTRFGGYSGISFHLSFMPEKKLGIIAFSSDPRVSTLTHLMANYAYNLMNNNPNAETVFFSEKDLLQERYDKSMKQLTPTKEMLVLANNTFDDMTGIYKNDKGWPTITLLKKGEVYRMKWGVLEGDIYQIPDSKRPYLGSLGALFRTFSVEKDSLFTGSLKYNKVN